MHDILCKQQRLCAALLPRSDQRIRLEDRNAVQVHLCEYRQAVYQKHPWDRRRPRNQQLRIANALT